MQIIIDRIKSGEEFKAGQEYDGILEDLRVKAVWAMECGRYVIRFIFPAADRILDRDFMTDSNYKRQYDGAIDAE